MNSKKYWDGLKTPDRDTRHPPDCPCRSNNGNTTRTTQTSCRSNNGNTTTTTQTSTSSEQRRQIPAQPQVTVQPSPPTVWVEINKKPGQGGESTWVKVNLD